MHGNFDSIGTLQYNQRRATAVCGVALESNDKDRMVRVERQIEDLFKQLLAVAEKALTHSEQKFDVTDSSEEQ